MSLFDRKDDLEALLRRCQKRDSLAWKELIQRFSSLVYSVARRYGLNEEDCADVFQLTFQALYQGLDRIEQPETLPKWLSVTASRMSLRTNRNRGKTIPFETEDMNLNDVLAAEDRSAEKSAVIACDAFELRRALAQLTDRCGPLLKALYFDEDLSYQEISLQLDIPVGAIGPTRSRCLEKLRKVLDKQGFFE